MKNVTTNSSYICDRWAGSCSRSWSTFAELTMAPQTWTPRPQILACTTCTTPSISSASPQAWQGWVVPQKVQQQVKQWHFVSFSEVFWIKPFNFLLSYEMLRPQIEEYCQVDNKPSLWSQTLWAGTELALLGKIVCCCSGQTQEEHNYELLFGLAFNTKNWESFSVWFTTALQVFGWKEGKNMQIFSFCHICFLRRVTTEKQGRKEDLKQFGFLKSYKNSFLFVCLFNDRCHGCFPKTCSWNTLKTCFQSPQEPKDQGKNSFNW